MTGLVSATIDLSPFFGYHESGKPSLILCGRERGKKVCEDSHFDDLLLNFEAGHIEVVLPRGTCSINPSFLEEFIRNAAEKLGTAGFREKVSFSGAELYDIENDLTEALDRVKQHATFKPA